MSEETKSNSVVEVYKARREIETTGVWCNLPMGRVLIKSAMRNPEFARKVKPIADQLGRLQDDMELFKEVVQILADTIVLDWDGFDEEFTPERFVDICTELKDCGFADDVLAFVLDKEMFNQVAVAKTAKN